MRLRTSQAKLSKISHSSKFTSSFERTSKFYSDYSSGHPKRGGGKEKNSIFVL